MRKNTTGNYRRNENTIINNIDKERRRQKRNEKQNTKPNNMPMVDYTKELSTTTTFLPIPNTIEFSTSPESMTPVLQSNEQPKADYRHCYSDHRRKKNSRKSIKISKIIKARKKFEQQYGYYSIAA